MTTRILTVSIVFCWAFGAFAADTHDYASYTRLSTSLSSLTITAGWPEAKEWNPAADMSVTLCYLVQSGKTLTSKPDSTTGAGGTWPCAELAVQGKLRLQTQYSRNYVAVIPHLAILPGGILSLGSAYGTVKGDTLDILGTAENPALITYDYRSENDKPDYYALIESTLTCLDAGSVVKFQRTASADGRDVQRAFRVTGGFTDFDGIVIVDGPITWLRDTGAVNFDIAGGLKLVNGGSLYVEEKSPTFGFLAVGEGSTIELVGGKSITVNGAVEISEGAIIAIDKLRTTKFVYDDGSNVPPQIPFLSVCGAENAMSVDRDKLLAAICNSRFGFEDSLAADTPRLSLVEKARMDGGVDFAVSHVPIVRQTKACSFGAGPYGYDQYENYLSDRLEISPDKDYYSKQNIYFKSPYVFPGHSLTVMGLIGFYSGNVFNVGDLVFLDGAWFRQMDKDSNVYLRGKAQLSGMLECRVHGSNSMFIESDLTGRGDMVVAFDITKAIDKKSASCGNVELAGDNSEWTGRTLVGCGREIEAGVVGLTNLTLRVSSGMNLGGDLEEFTFDSLKVADTCAIAIKSTTAFTAKNRGWCLMDGARVSVAAGTTAWIGESVTFGSHVMKCGTGTLVLAGSARSYDAVNDVSVETVNGETLMVAEGSLGFGATSAANGLSIVFKSGTRLSVDLSAKGDFAVKGAVFTQAAVPLKSDTIDGRIPLEITNSGELTEQEVTVAICTVPKAISESLTFDAPMRYEHRPLTVNSVDNADDTVTFWATLGPKLSLIFIVL